MSAEVARMSADVAVDAPPGLQHMGCGFGGAPLSPYQASSPPQPPGDMKDELIREVTDAVREHIETKTSSAVEVLWQRGQKALQQMQQNQLNQTAALRAQLEAHAETQKKLERDNAMLRQALEALVTRLSGVLSQPHAARAQPQIPSPKQFQPTMMPPFLESADPSQASEFADAAALALSKASSQVAGSLPEGMHTTASTSSGTNRVASIKTSEVKRVSFDCKPDNIEPEVESFHTPAGSPQSAATQAPEAVSMSVTTAASQLPSVPSMPGFPPPVRAVQKQSQASVPTFSLILRRADNVPLGLDVRGDDNETCLLVESVLPNGAVEAWNKQCPDNARIIKAGDRIIKINDAEDSDAMREQCINKYLLRLTVVRGQTTSQHMGSLRADADEFVPRVHPASSC